MSRPSHPPGCRCSQCHLSSRVFPRGPNDRIILPAPPGSNAAYPSPTSPQSPTMGRHRDVPLRPKSTAPDQYRSRPHAQEPPPPMPMPYQGQYPASGSGSSRRSVDTHHTPMPSPRPSHRHTPSTPAAQPYGHAQQPQPQSYTFAPPDRPASAMAMSSSTPSQSQSAQGPQGQLEWMPPRLKWVKKKERVSHFTPPSQYQGTSFRQYVHDGVTRPNS